MQCGNLIGSGFKSNKTAYKTYLRDDWGNLNVDSTLNNVE